MKKISFICLVIGLCFVAVTGTFAAEDASSTETHANEQGEVHSDDHSHRSWLSWLSQLLPNSIIPEPDGWHQPDLIPNTFFAVLVLAIFFVLVTRKLKRIPEGKGQTLLELFVGGIIDFLWRNPRRTRQKICPLCWFIFHLHSLTELSRTHPRLSIPDSRSKYNTRPRHNSRVGRSNHRY